MIRTHDTVVRDYRQRTENREPYVLQTISSERSSTVQYSTVQYRTVQYCTVQYSTVQYLTVQYITLPGCLRAECSHYQNYLDLAVVFGKMGDSLDMVGYGSYSMVWCYMV